MKSTNWSTATVNPYEALAALIQAIKYGKNAWVELQPNGEQALPVNIVNPELDIPFNWCSSYGVPSEPESDAFYINDTEKDLTFNWTCAFGAEKAIKDYQENGIVTPLLSNGMGIAHPLKKSDFLILRPDMVGHSLWTTHWKPKQGIAYRVPDPAIKEVYVVCIDDTTLNKEEALNKLKSFVNSLTEI